MSNYWAKIIARLYKNGKINTEDLDKAVLKEMISEEEKQEILKSIQIEEIQDSNEEIITEETTEETENTNEEVIEEETEIENDITEEIIETEITEENT